MTSPYFRRLAASLGRRGLPEFEVQRLTAELEDHADAAVDDFRGKAANKALVRRRVLRRFGKPEEFADSLLKAYRNNSFLWRHPILGFGLGPLILLIAVFTTPMFIGNFIHFDDGVSSLFGNKVALSRGEILGFCNAFGAAMNALCTGAVGLVIYRLSLRGKCPERNVVWAFVILALVGSLLNIRFDLIPPVSSGRAFSFAYSIGFGFPPRSAMVNMLAFLSPVVLFLLYHRRMIRTA